MRTLVHPAYFPSISQFVAMVQANEIWYEMEDNFQKQTNRNRMYIYSPNGLQLLNIPVKHTKNERKKYKDTMIENAFGWQKQHFKSLEAAYRTSPYFEYFEDDLLPIFEKKHKFMLDVNLQIHDILCDCLGIELKYNSTTEYIKDVEENIVDYRPLINRKKDNNVFEAYTQVFDDKHGFLNNLSILDLLFNEGRHAVDYLKNQKLL